MAKPTFGFATPLSASIRHLTHLPFTLTHSKPSRFSTLRATAAAAMPDSSSNLHPSLEVVGGAAHTFLPAFKPPHLPYVPYPFIATNRHVETIFAAFSRSLPDVRFRRECLRTSDDGAVALDWVSGDDRNLLSESPVLILLPGLTGGSEDTYVRHMLLRARSKGWRVVVFNSRGCGSSPVTTSQFYSASFLGDISEVVEHVGSRYPRANLYAAGWSLGANILVRYVGQKIWLGSKIRKFGILGQKKGIVAHFVSPRQQSTLPAQGGAPASERPSAEIRWPESALVCHTRCRKIPARIASPACDSASVAGICSGCLH